MSRGIHRIVVHFREGEVRVRAQSKSLRGTPFTVGHTKEKCVLAGSAGHKAAARVAIERLLPKTAGTTS